MWLFVCPSAWPGTACSWAGGGGAAGLGRALRWAHSRDGTLRADPVRPGVEPAWGRAVQGVAAGLQQPRVLPPPEPRVPGMLGLKLPQLTVNSLQKDSL